MSREIQFGEWCFCPDTLVVTRGGHRVELEPRVARLLEYFLAHPDEVLSHDHLVEAVWEGRVVSDDAVRRGVSSLRHALAVDGADSVIRTVHKKGYIAEFPPPVAGYTGLADRRSPTVATPVARATPNSRRPILFAAILLLVGVALAWWFSSPAGREGAGVEGAGSGASVAVQAPQTIAVLPFVNLTANPETDYFSDGLAEELLGLLARFRGFRVTSRSSSFQFRGVEQDARAVGRELGVRYLVEGSVRRDRERERLRITATLIDTEDGFQLWSETYDHRLTDLFRVQEEIALAVARALQVVLVRDNGEPLLKRREVTFEAHLEYLKGQQLMATWVHEDFEAAVAHFRRAIELAPDYAAAHAQLASALLLQGNADWDAARWQKAKASAIALVERALVLDPDLGEAYVTRAGLYGGTSADMETDLQRGLALNPSYSRGYEKLAGLYLGTGRLEAAFESIDEAIALDPLWPRYRHFKAVLHLYRGEPDAAEALEQEVLRLDSGYYWALARLAQISLYRGELARAVDYAERAVASDPNNELMRDLRVFCYLALGEITVARHLNQAPTLAASLFIAQFDSDYALLEDSALIGNVDPGDAIALAALHDLLLRDALARGDTSRARRLLAARDSSESRFSADLRERWMSPSNLNLAMLWQAAGEGGLAPSPSHSLRQRSAGGPPLPLGLDALYALQDEAVESAIFDEGEEALATLENLLDSLPALWWWVRNHPAFDGLQEEAAFQQLLADGEAHAVTQRARLDEMRAAGTVPDHRVKTGAAAKEEVKPGG